MSFFRYPGGKTKLQKQIIAKLTERFSKELEYREPFFGGGSIGLEFMKTAAITGIWINDKDIALACLWSSVILYPEELKQLVLGFKPSVEAFDEYKVILTNPPKVHGKEETVSLGFRKLAMHQISYSGLGTKSGGPLGGRKQASKYKIDCRWSPDYICLKIDRIHKLFSERLIHDSSCTSVDFEAVINDKQPALLYLDPPYYVKGNDLYQHGFTEDDHIRLARCLRGSDHRWVLSYDDCEEIRNLYGWANVEVIDGVNYSITALKDKETGRRSGAIKKELLITPN